MANTGARALDVPVSPPTSAEDTPPVAIDPGARLQIFGAILLGLFLAALDQTVVGTALPRIVTELRGNDLYTWVFTIYLLTTTVTGPIYGKLSDLFGRRPIMLTGVSLFLLGSFLSGLSTEMWQLILFRGVQGLGAGALFPIALAVIGDLFTPAERGKYQGLLGAVFGLSAVVGPAVGGLLTDTVGWNWVFFVNLPLGAIVLAVIWRLLPHVRRPDATRSVDYLGAAVFTLAVVPVLVGLTNKQTADWTDPWVGGLILVGLVLAGVFVFVERRAAEPIVPLDLFRNPSFAISVTAVFLAAFAFFATILFLPRWFQVVAGSSATESGYQILPLLAGLILSATTAGQLVSRTGRYKVLTVASLGILALGLFLLTNLRATTDIPVLWVWMFVAGVGIGPSLAVFTLIVQASVPFQKLGVATSNLTFFQQVGGTVGLAIAGTIFGTTLRTQIPAQLASAGVPPQLAGAFAGGAQGLDVTAVGDLGARILEAVPPDAQEMVRPFVPAMVAAIHEAFSIATASTFWLGIGAVLVAASLVLFLREARMRSAVAAPVDADAGYQPETRVTSPAFGEADG